MKHQFIGFPRMMLMLLLRVFGRDRFRRYYRATLCYERFACHIINNHGRLFGCKILKEIFGRGKRVAFGYRDGYRPYPMWLATDHLGLPRKLYRVSAFLETTVINRVFALSVLALFLQVRCKPVWNLSSIITPFDGKGVNRGFRTFLRLQFLPHIRRICKTAGITLRPPKDLILLRGGPWRVPSILGSIKDAYALIYFRNRGYPEAHAVIELGERLLRTGQFESRLEKLAAQCNRENEVQRLALLSVSPDRGGKTRTFTAMSYWIQYVLYPIHDYFMRVLKEIPEDYTYRQGEVDSYLSRVQREGRKVYSFDLTDATDRFDRGAQRETLSFILGRRIGRLWNTIMCLPVMVSRPTRARGLLAQFVRYASGQPMGSYSSWPVFAITHHAVVRYAFWQVGEDPSGLYAVLGDDVSIASENAARVYEHFVVRHMGAEISAMKSYLPEPGVNPGEFAKRLFSWGREITPLTPDLLDSISRHNWVQLPVVVAHAINRWKLRYGRSYVDLPRLCRSLENPREALRLVLFPPNRTHIPSSILDEYVRVAMKGKRPIHWFPRDPEELTGWYYLYWQALYGAAAEEAIGRIIDTNKYLDRLSLSDLGEIDTISNDRDLSTFLDAKGVQHPLGRVAVRVFWKYSRLESRDALLESTTKDLELQCLTIERLLETGYRPWQTNPVRKLRFGAKVLAKFLRSVKVA